MRWIFALLFAVPLLAESPTYITFPSDIDWVTRDTAHFRILYRRGEDRLAQRTLNAAERAHRLLAPVFEETPETTWIVLSDFHDSLNGYAIDFPFPHFVVFASPPEPSGQLSALDDWLESVVLHEYVHVLHLYPAHGMWSALRTVFGAWVLPNGLLPSHLHEGLATFFETEFSRGGRGRGTHFSMFTRMAVKEGVWGNAFVPLDLLEGNVRWPGGASPYYFGQQIYRELWSRGKAKGIHDFVRHTSGSLLPYWISRSTQAVYDAEYPQLWQTVFDKTRTATQTEIAALEKQPMSKLTYLTDTKHLKWDASLSPDGKQVAYRRIHPDTGSTLEFFSLEDPQKHTSVEWEQGQQEGMCWVGPPDKAVLLAAETEVDHQYQRNLLRAVNAKDHRKATPLSDGKPISHVMSIGCGEGSRVLLYQENSGHGKVTEWEADAEWKNWKQTRMWATPEGSVVVSLLPGKPSVLAVRRAMSTEFYEWSEGDPRKVGEVAGKFYRLSRALPGGEYPAIGDVGGREEIWAIHPQRKTGRRLVGVLGGINSYARAGQKIWVTSYRHGGYDLAEASLLDESARALPTAIAANPYPSQEVEATPARTYHGWSTLRPRAWIPSMLIVPSGLQVSAWIPGFDVSQKHVYNLFGGYDTRGSAFFLGDYSYRFAESQSILLQLNYLPSYIISNATFLKQWGASFGWGTRLGREAPFLSLYATYKKVENSSIGPAIPSVGFTIGLSDSFWVKTAARAIAPLRATVVSASHSQYFRALGSGDDFFSSSASIDQYAQTPWLSRHIVKLGVRGGITQGTAKYNSFFQGGGELQFSSGRGMFLNRGFLPGSFYTQKMLTVNLDYLFPLFEVERGFNQWPFFLKRVDAALVVDASLVEHASATKTFSRGYYSAGLELKSYWKTFFYFPTQIRAGFYHAFGPYGQPDVYITSAIEASI